MDLISLVVELIGSLFTPPIHVNGWSSLGYRGARHCLKLSAYLIVVDARCETCRRESGFGLSGREVIRVDLISLIVGMFALVFTAGPGRLSAGPAIADLPNSHFE
jgi:hypothetical protein